jgi:hypothetical protein
VSFVEVEVKVTLWLAVSQFVLVSSPLWDLWSDATSSRKVTFWTLRSCLCRSQSRSYFTTDCQSVCLDVVHPFGAHDQILLVPFFCRKIALLFILGCPLWREDRSVICSAICQWPELQRTHNRTLLSLLRLLGSLSVASYDSQGLWWKYSYPPPHWGSLTREGEVTLRLTVSHYALALATRCYFLSECCCLKFAVLYLLGALFDERTGLQFAVHSIIRVPQNLKPYFTVSSETLPTWKAKFPYLYPPGTGGPSYTSLHWVSFT